MDNQLQRLRETQIGILNVIDRVCAENDLRYSLGYGTLLGAVRHGGFIPWDDDIDVIMPREDYERFLEIWNQTAPPGYILQDYHTDSDYTNNFAKIRKDHTAFLQDESEREKKYHKGIFVDVFPGDRVPAGKLSRKIQYAACAVNLLYSRGYPSGSKGVAGMAEKVLLGVPKKLRPVLREKSERRIRRWNRNNAGMYVFPNTIELSRKYYPENVFDRLGQIEFEGEKYSAVCDTDTVLRLEYGDYMQLPPEEERVWTHHPIVIDFEHNYEELEAEGT